MPEKQILLLKLCCGHMIFLKIRYLITITCSQKKNGKSRNCWQKQAYKISTIKIIHEKDQIQGKQASLDFSISAQFTLNVPQAGFFII